MRLQREPVVQTMPHPARCCRLAEIVIRLRRVVEAWKPGFEGVVRQSLPQQCGRVKKGRLASTSRPAASCMTTRAVPPPESNGRLLIW